MRSNKLIIIIVFILLIPVSFSTLYGTDNIINDSADLKIKKMIDEFSTFENIEISQQQKRDTFTDINKLKEQLSQQKNSRIEWVVFANSAEEYQTALSLPHTKSYSTLRAIRVLATSDEVNSLRSYFPLNVFPYASYNRFNLIKNVEVENKNSIGINALEDADIMSVLPMWDQGYNGTNVVVGVIDNGVNWDHRGLIDKKYAEADFSGPTGTPTMFHGTPVTGTIVASGLGSFNNTGTGIAFGAKVAAANLGDHPEGYLVGDFIGPFDWLASLGVVRVINTSWGGGEDIWAPIFRRLEELNIIVIGSAGNEGSSEFSTAGSPGNNIHGVSVGSITHSKEISSFSSSGPGGGGMTKPDVTAPGSNIYTTQLNGGYGTISGTSFSSPLTAGGVAVLISALQQNNMNWTVGSLKAALMKGASSLGQPELIQGQGLVNITASWEYLINARKTNDSNSIPILLEATPKTGFFKQLTNFRQDVISELPFTLISSVPDQVEISFEGNISQILSLPTNFSLPYQSNFVFLKVNTTNSQLGRYLGNITLSITNSTLETLSIPVSLIVNPQPLKKILFSLRYTSRDQGFHTYRAGHVSGELIERFNKKGYWVDLVDDSFTPQLLNQYDAVWLPDPFYVDGQEPTPISQIEINYLFDYINQGGSLFIDYLGLLSDPDNIGDSNSYFTGNNVTILNNIINEFGMSADTSKPSLTDIATAGSDKMTVINSSTLARGVDTITSEGSTTFTVTNPNSILAKGKSTKVASYTSSSGGRVIVTNTASWFRTRYLLENPDSENSRFVNNLVDWILSDDVIRTIDQDFSNNIFSATIQVFENDGIATKIPIINYFLDGQKQEVSQINSLGNGTYSFSINLDKDGYYGIQVISGDDYVRWNYKIDTEAPVITPELTNGTEFAEITSTKFFSFTVRDRIDQLSKADLQVKFNNNDTKFAFREDLQKLIVTITIEQINNSWINEIDILASDFSGNIIEYKFIFYVGEDPNPPIISTSTNITTSETLTSTKTTTSTSSSVPTSFSKTEDTPIFILPLIISFLMSGLVIKYLNSKRSY